MDRSLEYGVLVSANLVGIAVTLAGSVLTVAQEVGCNQ